MLRQFEMNFDVHLLENNAQSQIHLDENRDKFSIQGTKVYSILMNAETLTVADALIYHGISSLPRRILDLKQAGVLITDIWITNQYGKRTHKAWFMTEEQRKYNREKFLK
jgi:hypothetical protein